MMLPTTQTNPYKRSLNRPSAPPPLLPPDQQPHGRARKPAIFSLMQKGPQLVNLANGMYAANLVVDRQSRAPNQGDAVLLLWQDAITAFARIVQVSPPKSLAWSPQLYRFQVMFDLKPTPGKPAVPQALQGAFDLIAAPLRQLQVDTASDPGFRLDPVGMAAPNRALALEVLRAAYFSALASSKDTEDSVQF